MGIMDWQFMEVFRMCNDGKAELEILDSSNVSLEDTSYIYS
jgi:hypothetical protein